VELKRTKPLFIDFYVFILFLKLI